MKKIVTAIAACVFVIISAQAQAPVNFVNPLLGTATIWDSADVGFKPTHRTWGAEVFPGSSLPNAMVQLSPVTQFHSGSGYQYEDTVIYGFIHTSKGHWNLGYMPLLPVTGNVDAGNYASHYSHDKESAHPGYYQVFLDRYGVNVELTSTLRCAFHKYSFKGGSGRQMLADLNMSNENVKSWNIEKQGDKVITGFQQAGEKFYFYIVSNTAIKDIDSLHTDKKTVPLVHFVDGNSAVELQIGFSFVSIENAKANLEKEMLGKSFSQVRSEATNTWNALLGKIEVAGGTAKQKGLFYSTLYRSFLWPALRSDANGDFVDIGGKVINKGFNYYTEPSLWDDYRNKLILLGLLTPKVANDVIKSLIDKGEVKGFMPTFFHGDHASVFITGSYLRGLQDFDVKTAYKLMLKNATVEGTRKYVDEYNSKGYISEEQVEHPEVETVRKAAVTKTLEYAYDDYAVALLAKALGDTANERMLKKRSGNYRNTFDPSTKFMRGRLANGGWVQPFDPQYPYYEYMYREANAWQSSFFAPHDPNGLVALYGSKQDFESKLDSLFTLPWNGVEAYNISGFIGQYCQGNQPDHSVPYMYYFINKQEKSQVILDSIMNHFYDMGKHHLSYSGMDDAGEMSSWYVFNAMGLYTFSPADPEYIVSVPLFDKVIIKAGKMPFTIVKKNNGKKIADISYDGHRIEGYFLPDSHLKKGGVLTIRTN